MAKSRRSDLCLNNRFRRFVKYFKKLSYMQNYLKCHFVFAIIISVSIGYQFGVIQSLILEKLSNL